MPSRSAFRSSRQGAPRILLDLTTSHRRRGQRAVGVTRTERALGLRLLDAQGVAVAPFWFEDGMPVGLSRAEALGLLCAGPEVAAPVACGSGWGRRVLALVPPGLRPQVSDGLTAVRGALRRWLGRVPRAARLEVQDGDLMVSVGAGWEYMDWCAVAALRARGGIRFVGLCYDLIPVLFPAWDPSPRHRFARYFVGLLSHCDAIACVSRSTAQDLREFAQARGMATPRLCGVTLGADLPVPPPALRPACVPARLESGRFALTVGTIEVRKNQALLLDVWERLCAAPGFDLDLVVVGSAGWLADGVIARLRDGKMAGRRVVWLEDADDAALAWLYEACHLVLAPSLYEGWGLPVAEALARGRMVIASDRGALPEVGAGIARQLDPTNLESWCQAVADAAAAPRHTGKAADLPGWDDTAAALLALLGEVAAAPAGAASPQPPRWLTKCAATSA